jgi:hypothetical protein
MTRSRIPKPYGIIQLIVRALALCLDIIAIALLIRFAVLLHRDGSIWGVPLAALLSALIVDSLEVLALSNASHRLPRLKTGFTIFIDITVIGTGLGGLVCLLFWALPCCEEPYITEERWRQKISWVDSARWSYCAVLGLRGIFIIWDLVDCCSVVGRVERKRRSGARVQAEVEGGSREEEPPPPYDIEIEPVVPRTEMFTTTKAVTEREMIK